MNVKAIMSGEPACCTQETALPEIARFMVARDCGEIPIVEGGDNRRLVGVVTERDIVCRLVAKERNPAVLKARDCMTMPVVTVTPDTDVDACCALMEEHQIRRVPVVDERGACCGIVAQADIARNVPRQKTAEVVRMVSEPSGLLPAA
jgi:CBS domain-containing protein